MTTTRTLSAHQKLIDFTDSLTLDQQVTALLVVANPTNTDEMRIRVGLIMAIQKNHPAITDWLCEFWDDEDNAAHQAIDYPEAILLARDELGI